MIKNLLKHFYQENRLAKAALLLSLFAFSCSDKGCIDADDFGEYESQTIEVTSNSAQNDCNYDLTKPLDDINAQGERVKLCFISGKKSVTNEAGETREVSDKADPAGCLGFEDGIFRSLCVSQCVQDCILNSNSNSTTAEPKWTSTSRRSSSINDGVTITPGAQIVITTTGNISLGDSATYPNIYVRSDTNTPHTSQNDWSDLIFDVRPNQSLDLKFSGKWRDNGTNEEYGTTNTGISNSGTDSNDIKIYNGAKRIVGFVIPHPPGYSLKAGENDEKKAAQGVPLLPDRSLWTCSYTALSPSTASAACNGGDYKADGYNDVHNEITASTFPISNKSETTTLGQYGGMIRWNGDNVDSTDLFLANTVTCDFSTCTRAELIPATSGRIIGDAFAKDIEIANPSEAGDAFLVSFKNLSSETNCNSANISDFKIWIKDEAGNFLDNGGGITGKQINFDNSSWSTDQISLEKGQKIVVSRFGNESNNCGKVLAVKFDKYKDIKIQQSGLVSFKMLGGGSGSCTLKGRIINPKGSHSAKTFDKDGEIAGYSADFYEHENFLSTTPTDPLANLSVNATNWTESVFARKGQVLRFAPSSWNGTWNPTGLTLIAKCGTGMAMSILPRPALLCRGKANDLISNPSCIPEYTKDAAGGLVLSGCQALSQECNDANSGKYCPSPGCQKTITCSTPGNEANDYKKSNCEAVACPAGTTCQSCTYNTSSAPYVTANTCSLCDDARVANAILPAKIELSNADQCYDLENYEGKVANINIATGFSKEDLEREATAKKAKKLTTFNGSYGNLESFYETKEIDQETNPKNKIFKLSSPLIFTQTGRLKFFFLDGNSFNGPVLSPNTGGVQNAYNDNSSSGADYNGSNGFKISSSGMLSFSKGQWMEIRLCKESDENPASCRLEKVEKLTGQSSIIDIKAPTSLSESSSAPLTSPYKFDDSGNLVKIGERNSEDCDSAIPNSYFYCHKYNYFSTTDFDKKSKNEKKDINEEISKLHLSFKIFDPEIANCKKTEAAPNFDGIILKNFYYNPPDPNNPGDPNEANSGRICGEGEKPGTDDSDCHKEFYCGDKYANNSGSYFVNVKVKNTGPNKISSVIGSVIDPVIKVMDGDGLARDCKSAGTDLDGLKIDNPLYDKLDPEMKDQVCLANESNCKKQYKCRKATSVGQAERVYKSLIADSRYKAIVTMCLVVMFTFYGVGILIGVSELSHAEIINRVIKIGLIYLFIGEAGWEWFDKIVVSFFKRSTDELAFLMASSFDKSTELESARQSGDYYDKSVLFSSVDNVFNMFFSPAVQKKISALLFASIFGWLYMIIIYWGFVLYIGAVANAVLLYLTAQVFISILFTLGPIFFIFTLFSHTKEMFDKWLTQLISFSLQQIFLLTTLAFFNMLMYEVIKLSLGYKICWQEVWSINIFIHISLMSFWTIASLPPRTNAQSSVGNIGNPEGIPSLFSILFIYVVASLMNKFVTFMTDVAASIGGGLKASELGAGVKGAVESAGKLAKGKFDEKFKAHIQPRIDRLDDKLFDSGAIADKRRAEAKASDKKMSEDKSALKKAGNEAVSDFKSKNGSKLAGKTPEEQRTMLKEVRDKAMNEAGEKRGLNKEQIAAVKADKGFKYQGSNAAMGAFKYAKSLYDKSLDEQSINTSFSSSEWKDALKNADSAGRAKMIENAKSGNIDAKRSLSGKALKTISSSGQAVKNLGSGAVNLASGAANLRHIEARQEAIENAGKALADSASAVGRTAINTANAVASLGTKKGRQEAAKGIKEAASFLNEARKSEEQKNDEESERQMVEEGTIDQMAFGTGWASSEARTKAIKERSALNKAQRATQETNQPSAGLIADMEMELEYLEEKDSISDDAPLSEQMSKGIAAFGKRMNPISDSKKAKMNAATNAAYAKTDAAYAKTRGKVKSELEVAKAELENSEQDLKTFNEEFLEASAPIADNPEVKAINKELGEAKKAVETAKSEPERKLAQKTLKKLEKNKVSKLSNLERSLQKTKQSAYSSKLKAETKHDNLKEKVAKLEQISSSMDKAKAIKDKAIEVVNPRDNSKESQGESLGGDAAKAPTTAQVKISELRANAQANKEKAAEALDATSETNKEREDARKSNSKQSNRGKTFGRMIDQITSLPAKATVKNASNKLKKFDSDEGKEIARKADSIIKNAEMVRGDHLSDKESREYKDATRTLENFEEIKDFENLKKFVNYREEKAENIVDEFSNLKSPKDFDEFNSKYTTAKKTKDKETDS